MKKITFTLDGFAPFTFDPEKHRLGSLCLRGHAVPGTSGSPRNSQNSCALCQRVVGGMAGKKRRWENRSPESRALTASYCGMVCVLEGFKPVALSVEKHSLEVLCPKRHEFLDTGRSLRNEYGICIFCNLLVQRKNALARYYAGKDDPQRQQRTKECARKCYDGNKKKPAFRSARKAYAQSDRGKIAKKKSENKRRALIYSNHVSDCTNLELEARFAEFDNRCAYCESEAKPTLDHFIPISYGGAHCLGSFIPACFSCNSSKQSSDPYEWFKKQPSFSKTRWKKILSVLGKTEATYSQIPLF